MIGIAAGVTAIAIVNNKLTAFGGTFLATLPIFAIITNSYTIELLKEAVLRSPSSRNFDP